MRTLLSVVRNRGAMLFGVVALAVTQAACAHPVVVEPSVVVHARLSGPVYGSVVAPIYGPPPVVAPRPVYVAPPMWGPPPVAVSPWGWGPPAHRHHHHHRWHGQGLGHGGRRH